MGKASLIILQVFMVLLCLVWVSLWVLKPTELWSRKWREAEDRARSTVFGYYGLDFAVYTFPVIALALIGIIYLEHKPKERRSRQWRSSATLSNPLLINRYIGVFSTIEILAVSLFVLFLIWIFYVHITNDFKKMIPTKLFTLNRWQYKIFRMATRCGLLAEACLALLLIPVLRGITIFRLLGIQFEASVRYHIWLGTSMMIFATLHGAGTLLIWGIKHRMLDEMWKWQKTGRIYLAGEIAFVTGVVIWITSLPQVRRRQFEIFYYTHHLYIVFLVFFLFHAGDRHFYMVFPGIFLFGLEKLLRIIQSRPETCLVSARILLAKYIELTLPKDPRTKYSPTSIIFMKIPSISKFQWHSFSIASSSNVDKDTMSIIIKRQGWWTKALCERINAELASDSRHGQNCIPVSIEGPYGPASTEILRYSSYLLIAGGIGVTPLLSILQEIAFAPCHDRKNYPSSIQLIYIVKQSQDVCLLSPALPLLLHNDADQLHLKLKVFVTQESKSTKTVRELLTELSTVQTITFDTKCSSYPKYRLEDPHCMAAMVGFSSILFLILLCCVNHISLSHAKHPSKQNVPSSETDLLLILSFSLTIICSILAALVLRWKKVQLKTPPLNSTKQDEEMKLGASIESSRTIEEHEIQFGGRPNFKDIFSKFADEMGGPNVGVFVCGPETMKESVASMCKMSCQGLKMAGHEKKPYFHFHSLNFTL